MAIQCYYHDNLISYFNCAEHRNPGIHLFIRLARFRSKSGRSKIMNFSMDIGILTKIRGLKR